MDKKLQGIISIYSPDFDSWISKINGYIDFYNSSKEYSTDEIWDITVSCVSVFSKIAEISIRYGKFKDTWNYDNFYQHVSGPELIVQSLKTGSEYKIGLNRTGIYLSTDLRHNDNLRFMNDDFWRTLLILSEFEGFQYEEMEFVRDERRKAFSHLFSTNKSMIYRILRKYLFDQTESDPRYASSSVGEFTILCKIETPFESMICRICEAFKLMYRLNYQLWKVS